jgi:hypothetical protein
MNIAEIVVRVNGLHHLAKVVGASRRAYALVYIGHRRLGRSRPILGDFLDLSREAITYMTRLPLEEPSIRVEIFDDRGDDGNLLLATEFFHVSLANINTCIEFGSQFKVQCDVSGTWFPTRSERAIVPKLREDQRVRKATLRVPQTVKLKLVQIRGLYVPLCEGKAGRIRTEARQGYVSSDHRGRIYLNTDLDGKWKSETQVIECCVEVDSVAVKLGYDARIRWTLLDVDDPTNDDPGMHSDAGRYVDASDYDEYGLHHGMRARDNEGRPSRSPPWEEVSGFALRHADASSAETSIREKRSMVRLHCPNTAGDNFILRVDFRSKEEVKSVGDQSGVMTMWHRIRIENIRMKGALALPVDEVPIHFEPCCTQLDFEEEREVAPIQFLARNEEDLEKAASTYVEREFKKREHSGWFCVIAALEPYPLPEVKGEVVYDGAVSLKSAGSGAKFWEYFDVPGTFTDADYADLRSVGASESIGFGVQADSIEVDGNAMTRCWIYSHDAQPEFKAGDGSLSNAYRFEYNYTPRFTKHGTTAKPGGYGMSENVHVVLSRPGAFYTAGISPTVSVGEEEYFAGRTIAFTHHGAYYNKSTHSGRPTANERLRQVIVHELIHAFGMPHKCGAFDFRSPRKNTCCMNYGPNWMLDSDYNLLPNTNGKVGRDVCGRHLKEIRRVHLTKNRGLNWK